MPPSSACCMRHVFLGVVSAALAQASHAASTDGLTRNNSMEAPLVVFSVHGRHLLAASIGSGGIAGAARAHATQPDRVYHLKLHCYSAVQLFPVLHACHALLGLVRPSPVLAFCPPPHLDNRCSSTRPPLAAVSGVMVCTGDRMSSSSSLD